MLFPFLPCAALPSRRCRPASAETQARANDGRRSSPGTSLQPPAWARPARRRVQLRLLGERIGLALQRLEQRLRPLDRPVVEARADVRGVPQLASLPIS